MIDAVFCTISSYLAEISSASLQEQSSVQRDTLFSQNHQIQLQNSKFSPSQKKTWNIWKSKEHLTEIKLGFIASSNTTEFRSDLKARVQTSTLEIYSTVVKPITQPYLKLNYAKYFITRWRIDVQNSIDKEET